MGNFVKFMTDNFIDSDIIANFSYSSQNGSYPASNLQDPFRSKIWRSNAGYFGVDSSNYQFVINDGSDKTVSLTIQEHTSGASLASDIQTQLNAVSSNWSCSYSTSTNKFTISNSGSVTIKWTDATTSAADLLGYNDAVDDTGTSFEADEARICYPAEFLKFDFGIARNPKAVIIIDNLEENIKIQPSITSQLQGNVADSWGNPETVNLNYNLESIINIDMNGLFSQAYRYSMLWIPDKTNPLGYVQLGKVYIGDALELSTSNAQRRLLETGQDLSVNERAQGGEIYSDIRPTYDVFSDIAIAYCSKDDVDLIFDIWETHRTYTPFFISLDSEATVMNNANEWTKYVRFTDKPRRNTETNSLWTVSFGVEELI